MARAWLVTGRGIARKIKSGGGGGGGDGGGDRECPNCKQLIDNSDVASDWPGFPAGVKFDPSDAELLQHLAAKIGLDGDSKPHVLIDEFIPTLEDDAGICYTHPRNLPGAEKDGSSAHFFHRISSAYAKGPRKRRRISRRGGASEEPAVRWHKTGKTARVLDNGVQKGWKKIMVLYESSNGVAKTDDRAKWVVHQYHIGAGEDESEGQLVVSKVFYQRGQALRRHEIQTEYAVNSEVNGTDARGFSDLDEILVDTPPDFELADLQFGSPESSMSWLEQF